MGFYNLIGVNVMGKQKNDLRGSVEGSSWRLPGRCFRDERDTARGREEAPGGGDMKSLF